MDFLQKLKKISADVRAEECMKNHTSFRIGGKADFLALVQSVEEIAGIIKLCRENDVKYTILGNGSNVLVSDEGIDGVVIKISGKMSAVRVEGEKIFAQAGALLSVISHTAMENGLTGLEFASGIPGTLGGALYMNAGAYGGEMKDITKKITYMDSCGEIHEISGKDAGFGYRKSIFSENECIILSAELQLMPGNKEEIAGKMAELNGKRREKQPLNLPSAGSTFKRPQGYFAGKLIEDCGLKGYRAGGAMVSEKHSGFVVNYDNASAEDVKRLIKEVQAQVYEKFGVMLEPEVKFFGR